MKQDYCEVCGECKTTKEVEIERGTVIVCADCAEAIGNKFGMARK